MNKALALVLMVLLGAACTRSAPPERTALPKAAPAPSPTPTPRPDVFALAERYDSKTPDELLDRLLEAEEQIRAGGDDAADAARLQQGIYRQLVRMPEWREQVYQRLPVDMQVVVKANVEAGAELRLLTEPREKLPPWRIVAPPPATQLRSHYRAAEQDFGINWSYLAAIHLVETRFGRIRGDSIAGAKGPMQFPPSTWEAYGEGDIEDPRDAIMAAARYLRAHGAPDDMHRALFAYNHSDHYVRAIELYAAQLRNDDRAYNGYYEWDVYYRTTKGDVLLYVGWPTK